MPLLTSGERQSRILSSCPGHSKAWPGRWGPKDKSRGSSDHNHPTPTPGYSVAVLRKACGLSYVAGAPRHKQRGAVFELQKEGRETTFMPVLEGEQVPAGEGPWGPPLLQMGHLEVPERKGHAPGHIVDWGLSLGRTRTQLRPLPQWPEVSPLWGIGLLTSLLCHSGEQTDLK